MKIDFDPFTEDAARPSRLTLDRFAAGELTGAERSVVQQWIAKNAYAVAHLDELRNAKKSIRGFDAMLLRARAGGLVGGERLQQTSMETFPPGMLDAADLAAIKGSDEQKPVSATITTHPDEDHSTQPFAVERTAEPHTQAALDDATPEPPEDRTEEGATRRPSSASAGPKAANRPMWMFLAPLAAIAASALIAVGIGLSGTTPDDTGIRLRGAGDLEVRVLDGGTMRAYDGKPVGPGATLGFAVAPGKHHSVVIVSVDSTGAVSPWIPASGQGSAPLGVADAAVVQLDGSVTLDATPGAEVFVAVFDKQASDVIVDVGKQYKQGGAAGVQAWADKAPDADAVVVEKR